jgi:hypothetical protein
VNTLPPQNPITRIEQVARDLERLAADLGDSAGPDAPRALLHWRGELLAAVDEILRLGTSPVLADYGRTEAA